LMEIKAGGFVASFFPATGFEPLWLRPRSGRIGVFRRWFG